MMFCPVKLCGLEHRDGPLVVPRWRVLYPTFWLANQTQYLLIALCSALIPNYEPHFYFMITGELE